MRQSSQVPGAVLDRIPVDQAGQARVADGSAEALVLRLRVRDQIAGDELVVELP